MNTPSRIALFLCVLLIRTKAAKAEDGQPFPQVAQPADQVRVFRYPSRSFLEYDTAKPDAPPKPREGVRLLPPQAGEGLGTRYNILTFYKAAGLPVVEATYFLEAGVAVLRTSKEGWELYDGAVNVDKVDSSGDTLRLTFTLAEFTAAGDGVKLAKLGYRELRQKAGATWRELRNLTLNAPSGRRASAENVLAPGKKLPRLPTPPVLKEGEELPSIEELGPRDYGIRCLVEAMIGPGGRACEMACSVRCRAARGEPALKHQSFIQLLEDQPAILQIDTPPSNAAPGQPHRQRALIVAAHVMKLGDWREGEPLVGKPIGRAKK